MTTDEVRDPMQMDSNIVHSDKKKASKELDTLTSNAGKSSQQNTNETGSTILKEASAAPLKKMSFADLLKSKNTSQSAGQNANSKQAGRNANSSNKSQSHRSAPVESQKSRKSDGDEDQGSASQQLVKDTTPKSSSSNQQTPSVTPAVNVWAERKLKIPQQPPQQSQQQQQQQQQGQTSVGASISEKQQNSSSSSELSIASEAKDQSGQSQLDQSTVDMNKSDEIASKVGDIQLADPVAVNDGQKALASAADGNGSGNASSGRSQQQLSPSSSPDQRASQPARVSPAQKSDRAVSSASGYAGYHGNGYQSGSTHSQSSGGYYNNSNTGGYYRGRGGRGRGGGRGYNSGQPRYYSNGSVYPPVAQQQQMMQQGQQQQPFIGQPGAGGPQAMMPGPYGANYAYEYGNPQAYYAYVQSAMEMDSIRHFVIRQVEYYFSIENLIHDTYFRSFMDDEGFVSIDVIASFPRMKNVTSDVALITETIKLSSLIEVVDGRVRRVEDWQMWVLPKSQRRTFKPSTESDQKTEGEYASGKSLGDNGASSSADGPSGKVATISGQKSEEAVSSNNTG
ncbi:hypothetical protein MIR68_001044 [Amoeboaphelidium protococcarum]|nr:hypothetical protein MIR68_001044 [Amoeboaphelidium protococcarum]